MKAFPLTDSDEREAGGPCLSRGCAQVSVPQFPHILAETRAPNPQDCRGLGVGLSSWPSVGGIVEGVDGLMGCRVPQAG